MSVHRSGIYTALLTDLIGWGVTLNPDGSVASVDGPTIENGAGAPAVARARGSLYLRSDAGNAALLINTDGTAGGWQVSNLPAGGTIPAATQLTLTDNVANAYQIGSAGQLDLMRYVTTDGSEQVVITTGGGAAGLVVAGGGAISAAGGVLITAGGLQVTGQITHSDNAALTRLQDNQGSALSIGGPDVTNLLVFDTTNGADRMVYNGLVPFSIPSGGLQVAEGLMVDPHIAFDDFADGTPHPLLVCRIGHPGGNVDGNIVLPARVGGWRMMDAYLRSGGATAGNITARTAAAGGGNAVTDAMVPGNANVITRAASLVAADEDFASGATVFFNGAGGPPATTVYATFVGL